MICAKILNVTDRKNLLSVLNNFNWKVLVLKNAMDKIFKRSQTAWNKFSKPAVNVAAPFFGMAVTAKTKNTKVGQATTNILKIISGGKILNLTDMHGRGLTLNVMCNHFK